MSKIVMYLDDLSIETLTRAELVDLLLANRRRTLNFPENALKEGTLYDDTCMICGMPLALSQKLPVAFVGEGADKEDVKEKDRKSVV